MVCGVWYIVCEDKDPTNPGEPAAEYRTGAGNRKSHLKGWTQPTRAVSF